MPLIQDVGTFATNAQQTIGTVQTQIGQMGDAFGGYAAAGQALFGAVGLGGAYGSTVGAVLANGFNLSCWGASLTPQKAQATIEGTYRPAYLWHVQKISEAQGASEKQALLNAYIYFLYATWYRYKYIKINQADWSDCAKKAINNVYIPWFDQQKAALDNLIAQFVASGAVKTVTKKELAYKVTKEMYSGKGVDWSLAQKQYIDVPVLQLSAAAPVSVPEPTEPDLANTLDSGQGDDIAYSGALSGVSVTKQKKHSSFPWWILLLGLGAM